LDRRQEQCHEQADDRDDDQQLDKREGLSPVRLAEVRYGRAQGDHRRQAWLETRETNPTASRSIARGDVRPAAMGRLKTD
jgi:hypothetical protein